MILNQIRVGGLEGRNIDESFPQQFGLLGEETLGAGGFSNALRTITVVLDQVRIIEKIAPKSIFVNLTNPSSLVLQAISRCSYIPAVAICDMPKNMIRLLEELIPPLSSQRKVDYYGTNHIGWITSVRDSDSELLNKAIEMLENKSDYPIDPKWISALKVIPNPYLKYIYETDKYIQYQSKKTRAKILIETQKPMWSDYQKLTPDTSITCIEKIIENRQPHWYEEIVVPFIEAFFSPKDHNLIIQIANRSYDDKLPKHQAIELQANIGSNRINVEEPPVLPLDCRSILEQNAAYENLAVEAICFEDRNLAFRALVINPLVNSIN